MLYWSMDQNELNKTASMARLTITEAEAVKFTEAVSEMIEYFSIMQNIDVDELEPTTHALLSKNREREDEAKTYDDTARLRKGAAELEDNFIVIPNVL
jgi:aspartyl-tRNA(Asn)/glutamyl-tRNA(Gln) amidotransferase subunit C